MTKSLNDILKRYSDVISGKNPSSTTSALTTGDNPGVDYADKMKDTRDFIAQHSVEKFDDRVGNGDDVYNASNVKKAEMERHGHEPKPKDIKVYKKNQQVGQAENKLKEEADLDEGKTEYTVLGLDKDKSAVTAGRTGASRKQAMKLARPAPGDSVHSWKVMTAAKGGHVKKIRNTKSKLVTKEELEFSEADNREYDYEGEMAVTKLKTIIRASERLIKMMKPNTNLPEWVQSKIVKAEDYITTSHDYLMSEMNEETELTEAKCNMSEAGKMCVVHGNKACPKEENSASDKEPRYNGKKKEGRQLITDKKNIQEVLTKKTPVGQVIKDFQKSDDPRFEGDSKAKRKERALAAWYKMHPEKSKKVNESLSNHTATSKATASEKAREEIMDGIEKRKLAKIKMKEQSAPAEGIITMPSTAVGDTGRV